jgi:hypothetical protein
VTSASVGAADNTPFVINSPATDQDHCEPREGGPRPLVVRTKIRRCRHTESPAHRHERPMLLEEARSVRSCHSTGPGPSPITSIRLVEPQISVNRNGSALQVREAEGSKDRPLQASYGSAIRHSVSSRTRASSSRSDIEETARAIKAGREPGGPDRSFVKSDQLRLRKLVH